MEFFYTSELKPQGWLKRQLQIQAASLSGNLDKIWRDVRDSAWIGGDAEGWERVPYWLDGFIPLAWLLDDEDMKQRAKKYIDAIIAFQKPSGWICPCKEEEIATYDTWAVQLISKVLTVYYECSGDERIPDVLYRVLFHYYSLLKNGEIKLFGWGEFRWFETFIAIRFLNKCYGEPWIIELARLLKEQGADYLALKERWKRPLNKWTMETHIVNLVMALKAEAVCADVLGLTYKDYTEEMRSILEQYNGTPVGLFTGDECLSGLSPIQGTELCAVAEQMYSCELLYAYTGDNKWAERLELLSFNALPATISDDMWAHQYVQMSNQIDCEKFPGRSLFRTNGEEAHLFGLEPNYGCCTANFNQAWPKFALSAYLYEKTDSTLRIVNALAVPSTLDYEGIRISLDTEYPFKNRFSYRVNAGRSFMFEVRIPEFAEKIEIAGKEYTRLPNGNVKFEFQTGETATITIGYVTTPHFQVRPYDLVTAQCGSLVFSVPVAYEKIMHEYTKDGVERKFPYCDYEYKGVGEWAFAYAGNVLSVSEREVDEIPFPPRILLWS
jgi:hypothetical protein